MIEVLKQALAALGNSWTEPGTLQYEIEQEAITAVTEAIAELESQEPVAWRFKTGTWWNREVHWRYVLSLDGTEGLLGLEPLYTHPPQRTWQGLTDEDKHKIWYEMQNIMGWYSFQEIANAIEAKLKERNI